MAYTRRLSITMHLDSPVLITAQQVGFIWESEDYIPGSVLRGAVAEVAIRDGASPATLFDRSGAPCFGPLHPGFNPPTGILPHTARTCKRRSGFRRDAQDDDRHGVRDTLFEQAFGKATVEARCPASGCDKVTLPWGGRPYAVTSQGGDWRYVSPHVMVRRIGRTGVARERAAVADRLLYTLEVIGEQMDRDELDRQGRSLFSETVFSGFVWIDEDDKSPWDAWLNAVAHIGGARSRGLGWVKVTVKSDTLGPIPQREMFFAVQELSSKKPASAIERHSAEMNLAERVCTFNQAAYKHGADPGFWYVALDLQSDTLVSDARGPQYSLTPDRLGFPNEVTLCWHLVRYAQAGGWAAVWGLPKPVAPSLAAGSVFVYQIPRDAALTQQVLEHCVELEQAGVGQRREEGFGQLQVCTPFHLETEVRL